jgi:hypothetical protein
MTGGNTHISNPEILMMQSLIGMKQDHLKEGLKKMMEKLDIGFLMKQLLEIEKLKYVLLDDDQ